MNAPTASKADFSRWKGRLEDDALLRGTGRFGDDVKPQGALAAAFVRSPHAFAKILRVDVAAAKSSPGVVAVFTAADLEAQHYHSVSHGHPIPGRGGKLPVSPHRPVLADKRVLHVGEPVALIIAATAAQAQDAAERVLVDYETLTPVTDGNRTFCEWQAEFDCPPEREDALVRQIGSGVFQTAFDALKKRFGS